MKCDQFFSLTVSDGKQRLQRWGVFLASFVLLSLLALPFLSAALAQVSANIKGFVTDTSGAAIPAVTVNVKNLETGAIRTGVADDAGRYLVLALPVGEYEVRVAK